MVSRSFSRGSRINLYHLWFVHKRLISQPRASVLIVDDHWRGDRRDRDFQRWYFFSPKRFTNCAKNSFLTFLRSTWRRSLIVGEDFEQVGVNPLEIYDPFKTHDWPIFDFVRPFFFSLLRNERVYFANWTEMGGE